MTTREVPNCFVNCAMSVEIINNQSIIKIEENFYLSQIEDYSMGNRLKSVDDKWQRLIKEKPPRSHKIFVKN